METEIWKDIVGYEGYYMISNTGKIKSLRKGDVLLKQPLNCGYPCVMLAVNGINKLIRVHVLLAMHFIPNPENKPEVNHKNGIRADNRLGNLEWMTHKENLNHAFDLKLSDHGERSYKAILKDWQAIEIFNLKDSALTIKEVSIRYNIPYSVIYKIWTGLAWKRTTGLKSFQPWRAGKQAREMKV